MWQHGTTVSDITYLPQRTMRELAGSTRVNRHWWTKHSRRTGAFSHTSCISSSYWFHDRYSVFLPTDLLSYRLLAYSPLTSCYITNYCICYRHTRRGKMHFVTELPLDHLSQDEEARAADSTQLHLFENHSSSNTLTNYKASQIGQVPAYSMMIIPWW